MIEQVLPGTVATAWTTHDSAKAALFSAEENCLRYAVDVRRWEFATGRLCARWALARLGLPALAIPAGDRGEPLWPPGIVGSITHCRGYRAAAVARRTQVRSVGIDAEEHRPLPADVVDAVLLLDEQEHVERLTAKVSEIHWQTILFSAKESVYKTWFPLSGRWLGFHDARLRMDPRGTFRADILVSGPIVDGIVVDGFSGCWHRSGSVVVTATVHPASLPAQRRRAVPPQDGVAVRAAR